jgi:xanthine/uracil permease
VPRAASCPPFPRAWRLAASVPNPKYADLRRRHCALVLVTILLIAKYAKGFMANISVLLGIVIGGVVATAWA